MPDRLLPRSFGPVLLGLLLATSTISGAKPTPRPIGPSGRAEYRVARLLDVGPLDAVRLDQLGFDLEPGAGGAIIAYLTAEEMTKLEQLQIGWTELPDPGLEALTRAAAEADAAPEAAYHNYDSLTSELQQIAADHPDLARLSSAGKTVQGREMWWLKISDHPELDEDEPGFKYMSTMHGDEVVGMENCIKLIHHLTDNYGSDARVRRIVDNIELWVMPLMNPDGNALHQRYNAHGVDLNRDFPDMYDDPHDSVEGREPETANVMNWQAGHATALSANFHGGALVVNYPYDNTPDGGSYYNASPDDDAFLDLALDYAEDNSPMYNGDFPQGVTNGADWYAISGGMQDWNYHWRGDMDLTIEVSQSKWPPAGALPGLWDDNRESMLSLLERALTGVRGRVTDAETGAPLAATVRLVDRAEALFTDPAVGDYHRPAVAGQFEVEASAVGWVTGIAPFSVSGPRNDAVVVNLALSPTPTRLDYASHRLADDQGADGWLDPGESGHLAVTLTNAGRLATGTQGELGAIDRFLTPASGADWPDIGPGAAAESTPPHCGLAAAADTPVGHKLAAFVAWRADGGKAGATAVFFIPLGAPDQTDAPAADTPRPIPDGSGFAESVIDATRDGEISEANVRVDITHPYIGDLRVTLVAPDGVQVRLHDHSGGGADNIHTWYDGETPPVDSLSALVGRSALGAWRLRIEDTAGGDSGTLTGWTLQLFTRPWENPVAEVLLRSVVRAAGQTVLNWWPVGSAQTYRIHRSGDASSGDAFSDVTAEDPDPADLRFDDASPTAPGAATFFIVSGVGHTGEGLWGHYDR